MYTQEAHLAGAVQAYLNGMTLAEVVKIYEVSEAEINTALSPRVITDSTPPILEDLPNVN